MAGHFEATPGGGASVALDEVEVAILRSLAVQPARTDRPRCRTRRGEDPLAALFAEGPSEPPSDPALARLFPEAYGDEDKELREASAEFRRFTENDLRTRKREDALAVVRSLDALAPVPDDGAVLSSPPTSAATGWAPSTTSGSPSAPVSRFPTRTRARTDRSTGSRTATPASPWSWPISGWARSRKPSSKR